MKSLIKESPATIFPYVALPFTIVIFGSFSVKVPVTPLICDEPTFLALTLILTVSPGSHLPLLLPAESLTLKPPYLSTGACAVIVK